MLLRLIFLTETSPHAWRKLSSHNLTSDTFRNISTCVEKTLRRASVFPSLRETSPHAWRKRYAFILASCSYRNISTCVEKTHQVRSHLCRSRKHLHMRGENPTESGLLTLNIRYIELPYAVFVKNQRKTTNFPDMIKGQSFFQNSVIRRLTYTFNNQQ